MNTGSMEILKMNKYFGIIAEDNSDVEVINEIFKKYFKRNTFCIKKFVGKGCGKLRQKCGDWALNLSQRGCNHVFVFHDLDKENELELRQIIEDKIDVAHNKNYLVIIPIREMEAWLLSDSNAIKFAFNLRKVPKKIGNTEFINSPKEYLSNEVWKIGKIRYLNTIHNVKIARYIKINNLLKCRSYKRLNDYLENIN